MDWRDGKDGIRGIDDAFEWAYVIQVPKRDDTKVMHDGWEAYRKRHRSIRDNTADQMERKVALRLNELKRSKITDLQSKLEAECKVRGVSFEAAAFELMEALFQILDQENIELNPNERELFLYGCRREVDLALAHAAGFIWDKGFAKMLGLKFWNGVDIDKVLGLHHERRVIAVDIVDAKFKQLEKQLKQARIDHMAKFVPPVINQINQYGPNSSATNSGNINNYSPIDFKILGSELSQLRTALKTMTRSPEIDQTIQSLAIAEREADAENGVSVKSSLAKIPGFGWQMIKPLLTQVSSQFVQHLMKEHGWG